MHAGDLQWGEYLEIMTFTLHRVAEEQAEKLAQGDVTGEAQVGGQGRDGQGRAGRSYLPLSLPTALDAHRAKSLAGCLRRRTAAIAARPGEAAVNMGCTHAVLFTSVNLPFEQVGGA